MKRRDPPGSAVERSPARWWLGIEHRKPRSSTDRTSPPFHMTSLSVPGHRILQLGAPEALEHEPGRPISDITLASPPKNAASESNPRHFMGLEYLHTLCLEFEHMTLRKVLTWSVCVACRTRSLRAVTLQDHNKLWLTWSCGVFFVKQYWLLFNKTY